MATARKRPPENTHIILCGEVDGVCPKCSKAIMKRHSGGITKLYEIAHIYPHSPRPDEIILLQNEERLTSDVDDLGNLIVLCRECHKIFDTPKTVEGYREMCTIKRGLIQRSKIKDSISDARLSQDIRNLLKNIALPDCSQEEELSLLALTIKDKLKECNNGIFKVKIENYVNYFYHRIQTLFRQLDKEIPGASEITYLEVKAHYLRLKQQGHSHENIFNALVEWFRVSCQAESIESSEALVSYFVQDCEVFE